MSTQQQEEQQQTAPAPDLPLKKSPRKPMQRKIDAANALGNSHTERMKTFEWPPESEKKQQSEDDKAHCTDCFEQSMAQHVFVSCKFCGGDCLDYQCCCDGCAIKNGRCSGCGCVLIQK